MAAKKLITVSTTVNLPAHNAWELWTNGNHIIHWHTATPEWHNPTASCDATPGGRFNYRMEAKDGSMGFDFTGTFTEVEPYKKLNSTLDDGRMVEVVFEENDGITTITETFEAEEVNSAELQQQGWQAILDNYKAYAEGQ